MKNLLPYHLVLGRTNPVRINWSYEELTPCCITWS